jgi:hypothetical protein
MCVLDFQASVGCDPPWLRGRATLPATHAGNAAGTGRSVLQAMVGPPLQPPAAAKT